MTVAYGVNTKALSGKGKVRTGNLRVLGIIMPWLPSEGRGHRFESCWVRQSHQGFPEFIGRVPGSCIRSGYSLGTHLTAASFSVGRALATGLARGLRAAARGGAIICAPGVEREKSDPTNRMD